MNAYFFKMSQAERNNILDQHKSIYDGFVTQYAQNSNQQPLYTQDYANDKGGLTVNNKGNVDVYKNMRINEADAFTGAKYLPDETFDFGGPDEVMEYVSLGEMKDKIGDGTDDMEFGTFDLDKSDREFYNDDDEEYDEEEYEDENYFEMDEVEENLIAPLQEQLNKTKDMFTRFKKY